jgi:hypothetical protein
MVVPNWTAGQRTTGATMIGDLQSAYRDEVLCPGIAETFPRWNATQNPQPGTGWLNLMPVFLQANTTVTNFNWFNGATAAVTPTHQWAGLYDLSYNQLAVTADKTTTAVPANTLFTWQIATIASGAQGTFITTYTGIHFVGWMVTAGTVPTPLGSTILTPANAAAPAFGLSETGQTTPPVFPHTATTPTAGTRPYIYMYLT